MPFIAMLALAATIGVAGCSGDNARDTTGPSGPAGPVGPTGPTGPTVPPSVPIVDGGPVTIGDGTTLTAEQIEQIGGLVATIDSVSLTTAPSPVVEFTVKTSHGGAVLGLAPSVTRFMVAKLVPGTTTTIPSRWQSYVNRTGTLTTGSPAVLPSAIQANTETAAAARWTELGNGKYRYTYAVDLDNVTTPLAVSYEPALTHRVGLEIRMTPPAEELAPDNPVKDFVPNGGTGSGHKLVAATTACENCHFRFDLHGGPRRNVEYCVTCHNPATVDPDTGEDLGLAYMAHSIHMGEDRAKAFKVWGFSGEFDFSEVTYPQSVLFCENCHTASTEAPDGNAWQTTVSPSACGACHVEGLRKTTPDAATGRYTYQYAHSDIDLTANDNECLGCHRSDGAAGSNVANHLKRYDTGDPATKKLGEQFKFAILSVTNVGENKAPVIRFKVSKPDGTPYDIVTDPAFTSSGASLNINIAWDTATDITNAKADGSQPGLRSNSSPRRSGYALQMNIQQIRAAAQVAGAKGTDGSYTIPFFTPVPVATTNLMVQMDGHPKALPAGETDWAKSVNAPAFMTVFYTGAERPRLVTQVGCENCHEYLSFHGDNRNGDPQGCTICHNASGGYADDAGIAGPIAFGAMAHNIHAGRMPRTAGITYPQSLGNCQACHKAGSYYTARDGAIAISTGSGTDRFSMTDDTWSTTTAGTCGTCHDSGPARAHMAQNGGAFDVVGGKTFAPSSSAEACAVCHGPGRPQDTAAAHAQ